MGNGLSIAHNPNLVISRITDTIVKRLDEAGDDGTQQAQLMRLVAERAGRSNAGTNFEDLMSPFDELQDTLPLIAKLSALAGAGDLAIRRSLQDSAAFAEELYKHGVSHVLDVIARESIARVDEMDRMWKFVSEVINAASGGEVTFANLNYDGLLMAALCHGYQGSLCDLADGRLAPRSLQITEDWPAVGQPLRRSGNLPMGRRLTLLHLHGSVAWLRNPAEKQVYRFRLEDVRDSHYWDAWREGRTQWTPVVVLTNQTGKSRRVADHPFSLAYDLAKQRFLTADKWLVAGTSLQDNAVNAMLRSAWQGRSSKPQVLVITHGSFPTERQILDAIGYDPIWNDDPPHEKWLTVFRGGAFAAPDDWDWFMWQARSSVEGGSGRQSA